MGVEIQVTSYRTRFGKIKEKIVIPGKGELKGARVSSFGDHRTAMSMIIAGLVSKGNTFIDDVKCIDKSFPDFLKFLRSAIK